MEVGQTVLVACPPHQLDKFQAKYYGQHGKVKAVGLTKVAVQFVDGRTLQFDPSLLEAKS
ncbi:MAG: hypothetical protein ACFB2W_00770 [Leptolyngbyaceae cyanobacterium]